MYKPNQLTPEQEARQRLMIEALREQAAYERDLRRKTVKKVKQAVDLGTRVLALAAVLGIYFVIFLLITKVIVQ